MHTCAPSRGRIPTTCVTHCSDVTFVLFQTELLKLLCEEREESKKALERALDEERDKMKVTSQFPLLFPFGPLLFQNGELTTLQNNFVFKETRFI